MSLKEIKKNMFISSKNTLLWLTVICKNKLRHLNALQEGLLLALAESLAPEGGASFNVEENPVEMGQTLRQTKALPTYQLVSV